MNCFQMAWRSVLRKPVKSILLTLVVCIISIFLLSGMASKNASIATQDKSRQAVGAGLLLEANASNRSSRISRISKKIGENTEGTLEGVHQKKIEVAGGISWQVWTDNSFETLKIEDIKKIASVLGIADYNITTSTTAVNPVNFSRIEDLDIDQRFDVHGVSLIGNKDMSMDTNVLTGNLSIKAGRMIREDDLNACVVSEEIAAKNNVNVGDTLTFNDYHSKELSKVYEAEIVGIYKVKQKMSPYMSGDTYRSENVIFTDLRFPEKAEGSENDPLFERAYFKVADTGGYDLVKAAVKHIEIDWERYDLIDNKGNLDTMSTNFNNLQNISLVLIWVIVVTSFVILFLVFTFWLKSRVQEVGILLAMGTGKLKILRQIILEATMIAVIGIVISFAIAPSVSKIAASYLVAEQAQQAEENRALNSGKVATYYQGSKQEVVGVNTDISTSMLMLDTLGVIGLIIMSVTGAGIVMLRKPPKDIINELS